MSHPMKSSAVALSLAILVLIALPALAADSAGKVNINTATAEQLMLLPRIGPSVAGRILDFREKNGSFKQTSDLLLIKGIGDKTFEMIEPYVAISGETSLKEKVRVEGKGGSAEDG
jgi:competence protein ComEA